MKSLIACYVLLAAVVTGLAAPQRERVQPPPARRFLGTWLILETPLLPANGGKAVSRLVWERIRT